MFIDIFGVDIAHLVCHFVAISYGLMKSRMQLNSKFCKFLNAQNLQQLLIDPCMFFSTTKPLPATIIFVDFRLAICKNKELLDNMILYLKSKFNVTLRLADLYIGLHITRDTFKRQIYVDQFCFIETFLAKCNFSNVNPINSPVDRHTKLQKPLLDNSENCLGFPHQSIVQNLMYLQTS